MRSPTNAITLLVVALPIAAVCLAWQRVSRPVRVDTIVPETLEYTIDLNTADAATLQLLPGVGPGLADAIVEHRGRRGGFDSVRQLNDVPRIGDTTYERAAPWVRLGDNTPAP